MWIKQHDNAGGGTQMPPQGAHEIEPENKQTSSSGYAMLGSTVRRPIYLVYLVGLACSLPIVFKAGSIVLSIARA